MEAMPIRQVFLLLLGLTYIGLGIFMYIKNVIPVTPWREILSILFIVYGTWRLSRAFVKK